jgi:hypothetical protein
MGELKKNRGRRRFPWVAPTGISPALASFDRRAD